MLQLTLQKGVRPINRYYGVLAMLVCSPSDSIRSYNFNDTFQILHSLFLCGSVCYEEKLYLKSNWTNSYL